MIRDVRGIPFQYVCEIIPELDENGMPNEYMPQSRYKSSSTIPLHKYGNGPFCRFKIPKEYKKTGVYVISVDENPVYVGECKDLEVRFRMGYGNISPRNCFKGGQPTNCRINNLILERYNDGSRIILLFSETGDRFNIESILIKELNPKWNKTIGNASIATHPQKSTWKNTDPDSTLRNIKGSKYYNLEIYLKNSTKQIENLSYMDLEKVLCFNLPPSAYNHRAWWANGGHTQAKAWLNAGWKVSYVDLGKTITFEKVI